MNVKRAAVAAMAAAVVAVPLTGCGGSSRASYQTVCRDTLTGRILPTYNCSSRNTVYVPSDYYASHSSQFSQGRTVSRTVITQSKTTTTTPKNAQVFRPDASGKQQVTTTSKSGKLGSFKTATKSQISDAGKPAKSGGSSSVKSGTKSGSGSSWKSGTGSKSGGSSSWKSGSSSTKRK